METSYQLKPGHIDSKSWSYNFSIQQTVLGSYYVPVTVLGTGDSMLVNKTVYNSFPHGTDFLLGFLYSKLFDLSNGVQQQPNYTTPVQRESQSPGKTCFQMLDSNHNELPFHTH